MEPVGTTRLTVYTGDSLRYGCKALYRAIANALHGEGVAGATVVHGIEGYGADKQIHTTRVLDLSADFPVMIIAVDRTEKIEAVLPRLAEMVDEGVVTTEPVRVIFSRPAAL